MISFELFAVIVLVVLAFGDLIVGVTNDAVNFLNSAIGSKVSSHAVIMTFASVGILIGATFSDGIIEVARKGIFFPEFFSAPEAILIFTAVILADIILLDLYSTFGLPTSTTVSIVFELLGSAFVLALWKMGGVEQAWSVINGASATKIVLGILLSIGISFIAGLVIQFISRMIFTFDYKKRFQRYGFVWGGFALTALMFFILIKGGKHATFLSSDFKEWVNLNTDMILIYMVGIFTILSFILTKLKFNLLKIIVLLGTASLAMAFAGNDLANFIGVSVAGTHAFFGAELSDKLPTPTWVLLISGVVMSLALITSKKARTVSDTELTLASHDDKGVMNRWDGNGFIRRFIDFVLFIYNAFLFLVPKFVKNWIGSRWHRDDDKGSSHPAFDLLRAAVNLMVAAAVISYATSQKLPLSTTYVTFIVAMGTALADMAWHKDCAPSRITGVLTVIGGWFFTAILAFSMAGVMVSILYWTRSYGLAVLVVFVLFTIYKLFRLHREKVMV